MHILIILSLLASFASNAEESAIVKGKFQVYLPKKVVANLVVIKLVEQQTPQNTRLISTQRCSLVSNHVCKIVLPYFRNDIDRSKRYAVNTSIIYQQGNRKEIDNSSFPVLTFGHGQELNAVISIPPLPID